MSSIQAMIERLAQLDELHRALLHLGEQKRDVLIRNKVNELSVLVNQEIKLLKQAYEAENGWRTAIAEFLQSNGIQAGSSVTVTNISAFFDNEEDRRKLQELQQSLMRSIEGLKVTNNQNQQLIEQSLAFINYSLDLLMGDSGDDPIYHNPVRTPAAGQQGRRLFDTRA